MKIGTRRILNALLLILPFVVLLLLGFGLRRESAHVALKPAPSAEKVVKIEPQFCNGHDWQLIDNLSISAADKLNLKAELFKMQIEAGFLEGTPVLSGNALNPAFIAYLDNFYRAEENADVPVFFALKIAEMASKGTPDLIIQKFKTSILDRLRTAKIIQ